MITIIGILVGALIVGGIWMCVFFEQEICKVRDEMRRRDSTYRPTNYVSYSEGMLKKERDSWKKRAEELEEEVKAYEHDLELMENRPEEWEPVKDVRDHD